MDGRQATVAIRADEAARALRRTPVVALTANALKEDRDACIAAGMDDYLVKPVSREQLLAMLKHWLAGGPAASQAARPLPADAGPALDLGVLMSLPGVSGQRQSPMLRRLLQLFLVETGRNVEALRGALAVGDTATLRALAHKMKSGCLAIGAVRLAARARQLDERMKGGEAAGPADVEAVVEAWEACRAALAREGLLAEVADADHS
jgi:HPt (histidine-containing phosphotransfer) domain-containing protein